MKMFQKSSGTLRIGFMSALLGGALLMSTSGAFAAPFTAGNLVIYRAGDGTQALVNTGNSVFLDEYTPLGALVQSIALPTAMAGANNPLIASGTATSEGFLTRSVDGNSIFLTGYDRALGGTGPLTTSASATVPRTIGRVDASGNVNTTTALTDLSSGNNPRTVISTDGSSFYAGGGAGGVRLATIGATTSTPITTTSPANVRQINIFGGNLYGSSGATGFRLFQIGTGLPTTTGQTSTALPGTSATIGSPYAFVLLDLSPAVAGLDTLYVADDSAATSGGGIQKYSLVNGSFVLNGTITAATPRGLTAITSGSSVSLFATTGGSLYSAVDTAGYNAAPSMAAATTIATAGANTAFRGIAFAPGAITAPLTTPPAATSGALISQFRLGGPGGASDEFIELANTSSSALSLNGWSVVAGTTTVPVSGTIPANGHLLLTNSGGYSLGFYAQGDVTYTGDIPANSPLTLRNVSGAVVDSVGSFSIRPTSETSEYAYVRRLDSGLAQDTGSDTDDFNLVDTASTVSTVGGDGFGPLTAARLGAPAPHNTTSPIARNASVALTPLVIQGFNTNARYVSKGSKVDSKGRLSLRRTLQNNTGTMVTTLRFRIVALTAGTPTDTSIADLRAISSAGVSFNGQRVAQGMTLEAPSSPSDLPANLGPGSAGNGGGQNSSWSVPLSAPLAPGDKVSVEFEFGINSEGNYRVLLDTELLP